MQKNTFGLWTDWTKFQELYEYHGLINEDLILPNWISGRAKGIYCLCNRCPWEVDVV